MEITPQGFEKAADKLTQEQLDRPVDEVVVEAPTESVPETPIETPVVEAPAETEEDRVPKSRFLTMHQRAIDAEKALRQFEAERVETPAAPVADDADLKKFYVETFGEGDLSDRLYNAELARLTAIEDKAAERAYERLSQREQQAEQVITERVESFDRAFEELGVTEGREFTEDEQVALLDIVEKYSPKNAEGKLIADYLLPLDQAYEIYQVQAAPQNKAKREERNAVAALSGSRSEGAPSGSADADWQPGQDRRWWSKVK